MGSVWGRRAVLGGAAALAACQPGAGTGRCAGPHRRPYGRGRSLCQQRWRRVGGRGPHGGAKSKAAPSSACRSRSCAPTPRTSPTWPPAWPGGWYDGGVDAITDLPVTPVAAAVQQVAKDKQRTVMITAAAVTEFTSKLCAPVSSHWADDTHAMAEGAGRVLTGGGKSLGISSPWTSASARPCRRRRRAWCKPPGAVSWAARSFRSAALTTPPRSSRPAAAAPT